MKFKFCGDGDCPDWILAEINTLSRLSSIKVKLLGQVVVEGIINPPLNLPKAEKLFAECKLDANEDIKACIACVRYIIFSAVRYNCDHVTLCNELQQLGLPREHSMSIKKVVDDHHSKLAEKLKSESLYINRLENVSGAINSLLTCCTLDITVNGSKIAVLLSAKTIDDTLKELKLAKLKMEELVNSPYSNS